MKRFARLLDQLSYQSQRNAKLRLVADYFASAPDPDRGYALAALTGDLVFRHAKAGLFRDLAAARTDPMLFALSYDYVGDLAETVALIWPQRPNDSPPPDLATIVETLEVSPKAKLPEIIADWLDRLDATGRWALIKFITGGLRIGLSARLAKTAVASLGKLDPDEVEEVWHALEIPYRGLFEWLEGKGPKPEARGRATFRPPMLAQPLEEDELAKLNPADFMAEWKWDGARVQIVGEGPLVRLYSRSGDEMTATFPEVVDHAASDVTLDGELLVMRDGVVAGFADLQKRLNRKSLGPQAAAGLSRRRAALRHTVRGRRRSPPAALRGAPPTAGILVRRQAAAGLRSIAAGRLQGLGGAGREARGDLHPRHRGADAEAGRQPLSRRPARRANGTNGRSIRSWWMP